MVKVCGADIEPTATDPKPRDGGVITSTGAPAPTPRSPAVTEPPGLPATVSAPCATPRTDGPNTTETVHVAAAASAVPVQVSPPATSSYWFAALPPRVTVSAPVAAAPLFV